MAFHDEINKRKRKFKACYDSGNLFLCVTLGEKLLYLHEKNDNIKSADYAVDLYNCATVNLELGYYRAAANQLRRALVIAEKAADAGELKLNCINNLAICYFKTGKSAAARKRFGELIKNVGKDDEGFRADAYYNFASSLFCAGEYDAAIEAFSGVIKCAALSDLRLSDCYNCLGYCHEMKGEADKAFECLKKALSLIKLALGEDNEDFLASAFYLAQFCARNKNFNEAVKYYKLSLKLIKRFGHEGSSHFTDIINRVADALAFTGDLKSSLYYRLKGLRLVKNQIGEDHIYYANNLKNAALIYKETGEFEKASELLLRSMNIKERILGAENSDYVRDAILLCGLYVQKKNYEKAMSVLESAMASVGGGEGPAREIRGEIGGLREAILASLRLEGREAPERRPETDRLIEKLRNIDKQAADQGNPRSGDADFV